MPTSSVISPIFISGDQQMVRIPLEFSFEADKVEITRNADGDLVIHPLPVTDPEFAAAFQVEGEGAVPVTMPPRVPVKGGKAGKAG
jgi:virulence-associated protein VagC